VARFPDRLRGFCTANNPRHVRETRRVFRAARRSLTLIEAIYSAAAPPSYYIVAATTAFVRRCMEGSQRRKIMSVTRRELCVMLPAMLMPPMLPAEASAAEGNVLPTAMYPFEKLTPRTSNSAVIRDVLKGKLATGESVEVHETTLSPGGAPHPPHRHLHTEMWLIREGTVELTVQGTSTQMGPGSVGFVRSNEEHGIKNVGTVPATYYVVAIGPGAGGA
jgi:mannose-6-phosphate isomerase-like protein (cupin superfamily)